VIHEYDGNDAYALEGGLASTVVLADGTVEGIRDQVMAVINGNLVEFVDLTVTPIAPAGYVLSLENGEIDSRSDRPNRRMTQVRHPAWPDSLDIR
jgi:hypothetical protein